MKGENMIRIDMAMPNKCMNCNFCQIAFDSDLFNDNEPYCCIESESVKSHTDNDSKPDWCPLINEDSGCDCCQGDEDLYWDDDAYNAFVDSEGDMMVTVNGKEMQFRVKHCPNCGKIFE